MFGVQSTMANNTYTAVGCAISTATLGDYDLLYDAWDNDSHTWKGLATEAGITFEGKRYFTYGGTYNFDGVQTMRWALTTDGSSYSLFKAPYTSWTGTATFGGRIYDYDTESWYSSVKMYTNTRVYFDATNWAETSIKLCVGHAYFQRYYVLNNVEHTQLYYGTLAGDWTDALGIGVVGNTTAEDGSNWLTNVSAKAVEYTGFKHYGLTSNADGNAYLMINNGKAGEEPTMSYNDDFRTLLNSTQTFKYAIANEAGEYVVMTSGSTPARIQFSSYKFNVGTYDEVFNDYVILNAGGTDYSASVEAARTATTTLMMQNLSADYEFVGWYDGSELISGVTTPFGNTYTYYPTEAKTITACFRAKKYTRSVTNGNYGTICLPRAASIEGADIFEVAGYRGTADNITSVVLVDASTPLVAGKPYIFQATAAELVATYSGDFVAEPVAGENGLIGKFVDASIDATNGTSYIIRDNKVWKVVTGGSGVTCSANRAYLDFSGMDPVSAPGVRELPMAPENVTDIQSIEGKEVAVKFIKDGKLFIQKNGVVYDMTGRIVK